MKNIKKVIAITLCSITMLSACQSMNAYTGEAQYNNTSKGAGAGAIAGALIGQLAGGDSEATLLGAGIGALIGTGFGSYMDSQENELRQELQSSGVQISNENGNIKLIMPSNITFAKNSANINSEFYRTLKSVSVVLKKYNKTLIEISGFTDSLGDDKYNFSLSENRANAVASFLQEQGINQNRLITRGYGENMSIASNNTADGRAKNRRVEITLRPNS